MAAQQDKEKETRIKSIEDYFAPVEREPTQAEET